MAHGPHLLVAFTSVPVCESLKAEIGVYWEWQIVGGHLYVHQEAEVLGNKRWGWCVRSALIKIYRGYMAVLRSSI